MIRLLLIQLVLFMLPAAGIAEDAMDRGFVEVTIEYRSIFAGNLQILDGVCKPSRGVECEKARIKATSEPCLQNPSSDHCQEARALLASVSCIEGLIFDKRVGSNEKLKVSVCTSTGGFGNLSIRDIKNGLSWTNYPLLKNGDTISYP